MASSIIKNNHDLFLLKTYTYKYSAAASARVAISTANLNINAIPGYTLFAIGYFYPGNESLHVYQVAFDTIGTTTTPVRVKNTSTSALNNNTFTVKLLFVKNNYNVDISGLEGV